LTRPYQGHRCIATLPYRQTRPGRAHRQSPPTKASLGRGKDCEGQPVQRRGPQAG
jgi:hypothetical protein